MSKTVVPIHAEDHRPVGWAGADDPGGPDPLRFQNAPRARGKVLTTRTIPNGTLMHIMGSTGVSFDEELNDDPDIFSFITIGGNGRAIRVHKDGLYTVLCRVACGTLATPFIIDFNHFLVDDIFYELYSYPNSIDQIAVDFRLAGSHCITHRVHHETAIFPLMAHTAGANRTIVEGSFFEVIHHSEPIMSVADLSWP